MYKKMKIKIYLFFLLFSTVLLAQNRVTTSIDTTKNKIGAQFNLTLKTTVDTSAIVVFPSGTTFGNLEVIRSYIVDTIKINNQYELIKKYGLTQFDSGKYLIPRLPILIDKQRFYSDSVKIEISNVKVDTLKQKMYEIKAITQVENTIGSWWKYVLGFLLIIVIGFLVYFLVKKFQKKKLEQEIYKTPIEKATSLLKNLETKQLWQKGEIKSYYSELTDIARIYIEEEIHIPAMESTTSELISGLRKVASQKKMKLSKETLLNLEKVLKQADLVKFAKSKPLDFEITEDKKRIENTIVLIHKAVPEVVVEDGDNVLDVLLKEKLLKKQRTKRIIYGVASVLILLFATTIFLIATKGLAFVRDSVLGHPTKDLLKGEWVLSEYGYPGILIETPKVLKRLDNQKLPTQEAAMIKDMQNFGYGSILDNFYVMVSTIRYQKEMEIDLSKTLDISLKLMENQGAQNLIGDQTEFNTKEGISGIKGFGTFSQIDPKNKKSVKIYYELLLFAQQGGIQKIMMIHQENDGFAKEISERMINSVEIKKATE
jgi:hypothetical protein